eukprot:tig00000802_g4276.t1
MLWAALAAWVALLALTWAYRRLTVPAVPPCPDRPDEGLLKTRRPAGSGPTVYVVTGASGCLGRHIVERLLSGQQGKQCLIRAFDLRKSWHTDDTRVKFVCGDLVNPSDVLQVCIGADVVIHAASLISLRADLRKLWETNVIGTANVVAACVRAAVPALVYTSSAATVMNGGDVLKKREADSLRPSKVPNATQYGYTKAVAEELVRDASTKPGAVEAAGGRYSPLRTVALRPLVLWGIRDHNFTTSVLSHGTILGPGTHLCDAVYVENLADAHILAAERLLREGPASPIAGKAYFISDGTTTYGEISDALCRELRGPRARARRVPGALLRPVAALVEVLNFLTRGSLPLDFLRLNFDALTITQRNYTFDLSAARDELGYVKTYSFEEAVGRTCAHWRGKRD